MYNIAYEGDGCLSFSKTNATYITKLQIYHPFITIKKVKGHYKLYIDALTALTIEYRTNEYLGAGFMLFGVGIGIGVSNNIRRSKGSIV